MMERVTIDTIRKLFAIQPAKEEPTYKEPVLIMNPGNEQPLQKHNKKIGRNDPCPCGSGKKYKKCCGKVVAGDRG
ncbi:MAG TPA: hypothetical protein DDW17_09465 [Deltaproteobacteria bacterium]|nr:hypothetical protein [Deltaproteobacteria bacterium]